MLLLFYVDRSNYPCFTTRQRLSVPFIYVYLSLEVTISVKTKDIFFFPSFRFNSIGFEAIGETG